MLFVTLNVHSYTIESYASILFHTPSYATIYLHTCSYTFINSGFKVLAKCLDIWYVGDPQNETIGLIGVCGLWSLGSP